MVNGSSPMQQLAGDVDTDKSDGASFFFIPKESVETMRRNAISSFNPSLKNLVEPGLVKNLSSFQVLHSRVGSWPRPQTLD